MFETNELGFVPEIISYFEPFQYTLMYFIQSVYGNSNISLLLIINVVILSNLKEKKSHTG